MKQKFKLGQKVYELVFASWKEYEKCPTCKRENILKGVEKSQWEVKGHTKITRVSLIDNEMIYGYRPFPDSHISDFIGELFASKKAAEKECRKRNANK